MENKKKKKYQRQIFFSPPNTFRIRVLGPEHEPALRILCKECSDYCTMVTGREPRLNDAGKILNELPPGKSKEDKFVYGLLDREERLVGILDVVRNYHEEGEWTIGLLMIRPEDRGRGEGRRMHAFVKLKVIEQGGRCLRLGVLENNTRAWKFWRELGYKEHDFVTRRYEGKDHSVVIMKLPLYSDEKSALADIVTDLLD
ncbi:MAG: GNAT family N-acetyltransferase [Candidatus Neomarinimicrobiota bacterium]|nr:GNAT family N-acetyltransferase [Candidatus Neomarinimicrobiota bacterium]MDX9779508.1 GNAT family N-acetyltransferase [bacterium]